MTIEPDEIRKKVSELGIAQPWNHNYILPGGIETRPGQQSSHGKNLVKLERLEPLFDIIDLSGKSVLDVGCNEGFFSIKMAEKGASVHGLDIDENRIEKARYVNSILGKEGKIKYNVTDIYSSEFKDLPTFDLTLCLGFIHRIPDPFMALAALAERSNMIIFEWKALKFGHFDDAFAYFSPKDINETDFYGTEYWLLSYATLERILLRLNFKYFHRIDEAPGNRAILVAGKTPHPLFERPDTIKNRGRLRACLSHCKRSLKTLASILTGRVNA
jgi:SAM-dependent methyltransferase